MNVYVFDTNIVSYYLKAYPKVIANIEDALSKGAEIRIAPIAYYEIRRGLLAVGATKRLVQFSTLCKLFKVGEMDMDVLDIAAEIYADLRIRGCLSDDADILIAAYCKRWGYTLVTHNTKHFTKHAVKPLALAMGI